MSSDPLLVHHGIILAPRNSNSQQNTNVPSISVTPNVPLIPGQNYVVYVQYFTRVEDGSLQGLQAYTLRFASRTAITQNNPSEYMTPLQQ